MDYLALILVIISSIVLVFHNVLKPKPRKLPPGPFPLPIIGNLFQLRKRPFHTIGKLAKIYGPIVYLKLGSRETIIISSRDMAKEVLFKHDLVCSGKPDFRASEAQNHREHSVAFLPVGPKWRTLRRVCKEHIFSMPRMEASEELRQAKMHQLTSYLEDCSKSKRAVDIGLVISATSLNLLSSTLFSKDFATYDETAKVQGMRKLIDDVKECAEASPADLFPFLKWFDPKGSKRRLSMVWGRILEILDEIISERLESRALVDYSKKKDLLEVLLDLNQQNYSDLSLDDIKHLLMDLIIGGTGTAGELMQWVMLELLRDPEKMSRVKKELKSVVGEKKQPVESDIPKLSYLNALIKETLRYHPLSPPIFPHKAEANVEINGYTIPKGATIIINIVELYKDPNIWLDPQSFKPERFLNENINIDYRGQNFEFLPFGAGRRACPALPLAHLMSHVTMAHIVHNFDFEVEKGMIPNELEMNEIDWIMLHKSRPYKVIPVSVTQ